MAIRMTVAAWQRGCKNALMCSLVLFAVLGAATFAVAAISQRNLRDSAEIAFGILWVVILVAFLVKWRLDRNASGPVLLDCGPRPLRMLFMFNGVLFAFMGVLGGLGHIWVMTDVLGLAGPLIWITASLFYVLMGLGRLQIRENGLWQYGNLLKWDRIKSYEWKGKSDCTLMLQAETWFPFMGRGALPVPIEYKEEIDRMLQERGAVNL